jgi:hypothetical protein
LVLFTAASGLFREVEHDAVDNPGHLEHLFHRKDDTDCPLLAVSILAPIDASVHTLSHFHRVPLEDEEGKLDRKPETKRDPTAVLLG